MLSSIIGLGSARFHTVNAGVVKDVKMAKVSFLIRKESLLRKSANLSAVMLSRVPFIAVVPVNHSEEIEPICSWEGMKTSTPRNCQP